MDDLAARVGAARQSKQVPLNVFVNRQSGVICRVTAVTETYARLEMLGGGHYSMPIADYDEKFVDRWRPARPEDLTSEEFDSYRPPANASAGWSAGLDEE